MQKAPPRYVPTLTQVVVAAPANTLAQATAGTSMASQQSAPDDASLASQLLAQAVKPVTISSADAQDLAQQLRQILLVRTRQYIDIELQRRIRETVAQLALEHAHKLFEEMQPQLEATIAQVIQEAVQQAVMHAVTHPSLDTP